MGQRLIILAALVAAAVAWIAVGGASPYVASVLVLALAYAYAATCWGMVLDWMGVFSLGHTVFIAAGAYASTFLWMKYGLSPWLGLLAGMLISGLLSLPIAAAALRRRVSGLYAALVTLIVVQALEPVLSRLEFLGGAIGLYIPVDRAASYLSMQFDAPASFVRVLIVMNVLLVLFLEAIKRSRFGYRVRSLRDDEAAAESVGINVSRYKIAAFMMSAVLIAPVGTILAQYHLFVTPASFLSLELLISLIIVGLVGGVAATWGPLIGALLVVPATQQLAAATGNKPGLGTLIFAVVLAAIALFYPRGISGAIVKRRERRLSITTEEVSSNA